MAPTTSWAERSAWTLTGVALINWSVQLVTATTSFAWVAAVVVLAGAWGLATVMVSWLPLEQIAAARRFGSAFAWATAVMVVVALGTWCYVQVRNAPGYGTDELAFDQYAAALVQHGMNPYLHSMGPAFQLFHVSPDGYTYTVAGKAVTALSYPALSFLVYLPFLLLGWSTQMAVAVNVIAWCLAILLLFALLPARTRTVGLILSSISVYVAYAVGGVTDALYIPLLVGAAFRWQRFGETRWSYLGPVLFGLAMAIKQTPWLICVFVLYGLFSDTWHLSGMRTALRRTGLYAGIAFAAFLVPNLPFMVMNLSAWLKGIQVPITGHMVPAGQGAIALSLFLKLGGGSLTAYTAATAFLAILLIVAYIGTYPLMRPVAFVLPAVVLFFAARSYGNYLAALVPAALVGALTTDLPAPRRISADGTFGRWAPRSRWWRAAAVGSALAFGASVAWALLDRPPLSVTVTAARSTGQLATIEQLTVRVTNRSSRTLAPAFTINEGGGITTFWRVAAGPGRLSPGSSASYRLLAPNFQAQPSLSGGFSVMVLTQNPNAVSVSGVYRPSNLHLGLSPDALNRSEPLGRTIVVKAQLLNEIDRPVRRGGVPVSLGQIIYDQSGLEFSEAQVNGRPPGQTPVTAETNANGIATFDIVNREAVGDPVYFEANLVNARLHFPYGYSDILAIRFKR